MKPTGKRSAKLAAKRTARSPQASRTDSTPAAVPAAAPKAEPSHDRQPERPLPSGGRKRPREILDAKVALARMFPVHVGIDTGKSFHQLVARGPAGERTKPRKVPVTRADFEAADRFLRESFPGIRPEQMLVGVELAGHHGLTFAHFLAGLGYRLVNVLPSVTKRLKEVEDNSPQKDDAKDAGQICGLLASGFFVTFAQLAEPEAELRVLTTERERLTREATRLKNRLQAVLDVCWPEFVGEFCAIDKPTPRALLERWPVAADLAQAAPQAVHHLVRTVSRNHIPPAQIRRLLALAKGSVAVPHGLAARRTEVRRILARWALVDEQLAAIDAQLAPLVEQHRGAKALTSVPGIGVVAAASIIAELGTPGSYESPRQVLKLAGMNLAGPSSGTSVRGRVRQTKRGRPALRRQLFLLAGRWCQRRGLYRAQYLAYRARGQSQTEAICAVARKLVPMLLQIAQTGQLFDLARWGAAHRVPTPAPGTRTDTTEPRTAATAQGGRPNRAA